MNIKNILLNINQILDDLLIRTNEISKLLYHYDIETSAVDEILELILSRNEIIDELNVKQQQMLEIIKQLNKDNIKNINDELFELKNQIINKLTDIADKDKENQIKIAKYKKLLSDQLSNILNGKKLAKVYNLIPYRKALFVDVARQE